MLMILKNTFHYFSVGKIELGSFNIVALFFY